MSHLIEVISAQNPGIYKGLCGGRLICISIGYLSLIIFLLLMFLLPLPYGGVLRHILRHLGNGWYRSLQSWDSSTDQSWRVLQAPSHAKSELLGTDAHRDLNFFSPSLHSQICYSPQDHLSRGMPDVICESMDGVESQVNIKNNPLVSKAPFISEVFASTARAGKVSLTCSLFSDDDVLPHLLMTDTFSHKIRGVTAQSLEETVVTPIFRKDDPKNYKLMNLSFIPGNHFQIHKWQESHQEHQHSFTKGKPCLTNFTNFYEEMTGLDLGEEEWTVSAWMYLRTSMLSHMRCP